MVRREVQKFLLDTKKIFSVKKIGDEKFSRAVKNISVVQILVAKFAGDFDDDAVGNLEFDFLGIIAAVIFVFSCAVVIVELVS